MHKTTAMSYLKKFLFTHKCDLFDVIIFTIILLKNCDILMMISYNILTIYFPKNCDYFDDDLI